MNELIKKFEPMIAKMHEIFDADYKNTYAEFSLIENGADSYLEIAVDEDGETRREILYLNEIKFTLDRDEILEYIENAVENRS